MSRLFDYRLTMELEKNQKQADKIKKALCMYKPKFDEQGKQSIKLYSRGRHREAQGSAGRNPTVG